MNDIRWGILGTGSIAHTFTSDLLLDEHTVAAVGSRTQESADAFAAEFGIRSAHGSYEALVADPEVDIVYIATPHTMHAANAELALGAGKHVLVEKPFTLNAAQARRVVTLGEQRGLLVMEAMWTRFLPHVERIREILSEGSLGRVREFSADHQQKLSDDPAHRINALELGGGALLDLGVYPISFASMLFGVPELVQAWARFSRTDVDAGTVATLGYRDGQAAVTRCALDVAGPNTAVITGTQARIEIDPLWFAPTSFRVIDYDGVVQEEFVSDVPGWGKQYEAREAERLIAAGATSCPVMPTHESVSIMEILDKVRDEIAVVYPEEAREARRNIRALAERLYGGEASQVV